MKNNNENLEKKLLDMVKQKEETDKKLLIMEFLIGVETIAIFLFLVVMASLAQMQEDVRLLIIIPSTIFVVIVCSILLKIEQMAGYYECKKCHHKHVPSYSSVLWAMHYGRTRYMKCPECNKRSWNKKVISKE
jgi:DNA-directed RNA polymerase subunit RPC12/RpoP